MPLVAHPSAPIESRQWYALLVDAQGRVHAYQHRFDRIGLQRSPTTSDGDAPDAARSAWRFDDIVVAGGVAATLDGERHSWQTAQRVAAGLAHGGDGAPTGDGFVAARVLDQSLDFARTPGRAVDECAGEWTLRLPGSVRLRAQQSVCPTVTHIDGLYLSEALPLLVRTAAGARGVAWQRHSWGALPPAPGAVRFDVATLTLAGVGTVQLVRSRRRSGRGRTVVTAQRVGDDPSAPVHTAEWSEPTATAQGERVTIPELGVDVRLQRLALTADAASEFAALMDTETGWRGALFATGSHDGAGFAELAR